MMRPDIVEPSVDSTPYFLTRNSSGERENFLMGLDVQGLPKRVRVEYRRLLTEAQKLPENNRGQVANLARMYIAEAYLGPSLPATRGLENDQLEPEAISSRRLVLENSAEYLEELARQIVEGEFDERELRKRLARIWFLSADLRDTFKINLYDPNLADHQIKRIFVWIRNLGNLGRSAVCRQGDEFVAVIEATDANFSGRMRQTYAELVRQRVRYKETKDAKEFLEGKVGVRAGAVNLLAILTERLEGIDEIISMNQESTPQQKIFALVGLAIDEVEKRMRQMETKSPLLIVPAGGELIAEQTAKIRELAAAIITQPEKKMVAAKRKRETPIPQGLLEEINSASGSSKTVGEILIGLAENACLDPLFSDLQIPVLTRSAFIRLAEQANRDRPIALVQINPELIKEMNDQNGHAAVDRVLRATGEILYRNAADYGFQCFLHRQGIKFWLALSDLNGGLCQKRIDKFIALAERKLAMIKSLPTGVNEDLKFASATLMLVPGEGPNIYSALDNLYALTKTREIENYRKYLISDSDRAKRIEKERPVTVASWKQNG